MADEMISGPDLGGGYLHQLTMESRGPFTRFTFHAQVGGADASGPPLGPLDPFGFVHPPSQCPFGGPRCWHRTFDLATDATPAVRATYNRLRFVFGTLLEQRYAGRPPAVAAALSEVASRLGTAEEGTGRWWYVGGSTAAWLQGASIQPHDIDLGVGEAGVSWLGEKLREYLIEPVARTTWGTDRDIYGARAFVGTLREGTRAEWGVGQVRRPADARFEEWSGDPERVRTRTVEFQGRSIVVSRPEYALVRALERGALDRALAIREPLHSIGVDRELLAELLERSTLTDAQRAALADELVG